MARIGILAALAVTLLLSTGVVASATESEERALRERLADRDEYRTKLLIELQRRETLLTQQQEVLSQQEQRLQEFYGKLSQPISEDEEDAGAAGGPTPVATSVTGKKIKPDTPQAKRGKDFETQTYKTNLARYNVAHTRKDIADLRALLARNP
jgi:hypothetical protein